MKRFLSLIIYLLLCLSFGASAFADDIEISGDFSTVGNIVTFGTYEQDNDLSNGPEPIEWIVLDVQEGKSLLLSRYALDSQLFNEENIDVTWKDCTLRKWLNNTFLASAFSAEEQALIPTVKVSADKNPDFKTSPGKDSKDQIFLLSISEVKQYYPSEEARQCQPTAYAEACGCLTKNVSTAETCWWTLRTVGALSNSTADVEPDGYIRTGGCCVIVKAEGIRPALWVTLP